MAPNNCSEMIGIIATIAIIPKPSKSTLASGVISATPWMNAKMKVAVIGPEATPPASKAIPTNSFGTQ